jgi:alanine-glyoxylate transaminase/serine-glyoxylate transaminase/serine-pyruvate transaminase
MTTLTASKPRLLCGPGPTNVDPAVLEAMHAPMLGHLDPDFHEILLEVVADLREVYRADDGALVLAIQATGTAGMEAGIANLVEPGDTVIVGSAGYFGERICEIARRYGANVVPVPAPWGECVPNARLLETLERHPQARLLAVVHAETSTGVEHPLGELAFALNGSDTLLMADCVTSLGGVTLDVGGWRVDYAFSCTQKCLAAPPGLSPVAVSERALERIQARKTPVPFCFDLELLRRYWIERPVTYHHTAPILGIYALREALRRVLDEGLQARVESHDYAGRYLQRQLRARGFELLADPAHQLAPLTAVRVPEGIDGREVQMRLLREYGIEVGGGLGPAAPPMWRIGLMGANATTETADTVLAAFDSVLRLDLLGAGEDVPRGVRL